MGIVYKCGMTSMDFERVADMLSQAYWSLGIKAGEMKKAAANSALVIGAFSEDGRQIAYGRVISDKTRFAYLTDFYVDVEFRQKGICRQMVKLVMDHPDLADVYQWLLVTGDAHGIYEKCGFKVFSRPLDFMEIRNPRPKDR